MFLGTINDGNQPKSINSYSFCVKITSQVIFPLLPAPCSSAKKQSELWDTESTPQASPPVAFAVRPCGF